MQRDHENQQQLNDKRTYFGPDGLTNDQERAILKSKRAQQKEALQAQMEQNTK